MISHFPNRYFVVVYYVIKFFHFFYYSYRNWFFQRNVNFFPRLFIRMEFSFWFPKMFFNFLSKMNRCQCVKCDVGMSNFQHLFLISIVTAKHWNYLNLSHNANIQCVYMRDRKTLMKKWHTKNSKTFLESQSHMVTT